MRSRMRGDINYNLTPTEIAVLKLLAKGLTYTEVGRHLGNTGYTVRNHMVSVRLKLGALNSIHAVVIAKDRVMI